MARYGIFVYSPAPADPMSLTPEDLASLDRYQAEVEALGVTLVTGFAFQPSTTATSIRGDAVSDGPFHDAPLVAAGFFVVEAANLDVALAVAKANPATRDGGVEVRPLFEPPAA